jgi:NAD+ kinase
MKALPIAVVGKKPEIAEAVVRQRKDFRLERKRPAFVLCFGGDGTLLFGERKFPGIPKIRLRNYPVSKAAARQNVALVLDALAAKKFKAREETKLVASAKGKRLVALNEISLHHKPTRAVRFSLAVNGKLVEPIVIGDGVVIATHFGSTAYFKSISGRSFGKGKIGIALHAVHNRVKRKTIVLPESARMRIKILRGPAFLCADNCEKMIELKQGDSFGVRKGRQKARILEIPPKGISTGYSVLNSYKY